MYLEKLSNLPGVSGDEGKVRQAIIELLKGQPVRVASDSLGNVLVRKEGRGGSTRAMLAAHMDEVGLMVTSIEKNGLLKFKAVGGIDSRVLVAKTVRVGPDGIPGVIGGKAVHLQKEAEWKKPYEVEQLSIDIGAKNKDEAEKHVKIGAYVSFDTTFVSLGDGCCLGKAFDDRAGCAMILELLMDKGGPGFDAAFTVQEEVGSRGAQVAAYTLKPERALALEGTAAADTPGTTKEKSSTMLGYGPAVSIMDRSLIANREILQQLIKAGQTNGVPFQFRRFTGGGTDAGAIALTREGVKAGVVAVPCRYIHSPLSMLKESDYENTVTLVRAWLESLA